ncbi:peptidylprolyl isomerase [Candidatus Venteria ishoeyi]|uniref:peptidylprolyl isomerase n=1 Tax=Candidatus Venteria ishoeyi TaxID=1899563 RepID=UPI0025A547C3|nr:peptidylprolyl isomerase [Candidatus Venteria ishoeyi]MDM8548283.1 peptidylprolyl isomerase [Candidatus Venteria ishoeyi]
MKFPHFSMTVLSLALLTANVTVSAGEAADAKGVANDGMAKDTVLVQVNDKAITRQDYDDYMNARRKVSDVMPDPTGLINELIGRELFYQEAVAKGMDKKPGFVKKMETLRYNLLAENIQNDFMENHKISDEDAKKEYDRIIAENRPNEYSAQHILVETEAAAKQIIVDLAAGKDFAELAKAQSTDKGSAEKGGDLGWFSSQQMVPAFGAAVAAMKKGESSKTPIQSRFGWHVILLNDMRPAAVPDFEQVKAQVVNRMKTQALADYAESLDRKAKVMESKAFKEKMAIFDSAERKAERGEGVAKAAK